ncbi:alpha-galactosidase [Mangrovibacterium diazotrophicum]|uniref:Alpha-galactosidase n=1 Tax=Mangrovibacterium diazotrophicum TaxID=1261403 RepID=A0A419W5L2_9BACT|nr:alpha-galactosidase [Mangrovibacterium diazotrophicum]RKD90737.1 alpha-galactosidase [Mangrovibacterium diazotrophicum]
MNNYLKNLFFCLGAILLISVPAFGQNTSVIEIKTKSTSLVYTVDQSNRLVFQYYGKLVDSTDDFKQHKAYSKPDTNRDFSYEAYPTFGLGNINEPALAVIHADGSLNTELAFQSVEQIGSTPDVSETVIHLKDRVFDFKVELHTKAFSNEDVITQWTVISNDEEGAVKLTSFASSFLPLKAESYYLTHFCGAWAGEMGLVEEKVENGIKVIECKKGVRTTQTENPSFILSLNHPALENAGDCYGGALAWSGNYRLAFQVDEWKTLNVVSGINPFLSAWTLNPGENFTTPEMIYTFSSEGRGQVSRNLHDWGRQYGMVGGNKIHDIVLNSWEGAYFTFNENTLTGMMDDAAEMGIETFVLDDGWFGNKYPRNNDDAGLGDWQTNKKKLPRGLDYLIDYAHSKGLKFGLWIEPEMVNPESELAENHPERIVQSPGREKITWRNQLLLDLSNPKVQDFVYNVFDSLLTTHPGIEYIKWDANRHVEQAGSTFLPASEQTHFWVSYTEGLYTVYKRIRAKYPDFVIQDCASGGGRLDYGALQYHNEYWTSDNTDPLSRIFIQYGTNLIYPPVGAASHVSTSPNHQTQRMTPLKFRFDVAMTGRLGMELQPKHIQGNDRVFAEEAIKNYKQFVRPLVTNGDLYRIKSPYDEGGWASQMYVSKDQTSAVLFAFSLESHLRGVYPTVKLNGLDPEKSYQIQEINTNGRSRFWGDGETFKADYLMNVGLELKIADQYDSAVILLKEIDKE